MQRIDSNYSGVDDGDFKKKFKKINMELALQVGSDMKIPKKPLENMAKSGSPDVRCMG